MIKISFSIFLILLTSSCVNKKIMNGNLPDAETISILKIGKDDKNTINNLLGQPSFEGALGDNSYYYIGTLSSKFAFLRPKIEEQYILELSFDRKNTLKNIFFYDKSKSTEVAMSSLETKSIGVKQSILQQLLGNFGVPGMKRGGPIIGSGKADD